MKRHVILCAALLFFGAAAGHTENLDRAIKGLLTSLSRQYAEAEVFFKQPIAVLPFESSGPLVEEHDIAVVVEDLVRREIALSTYFILTERRNLERILEEVELSLTDFASSETAVRVGEITGAAYFLAGGVAEVGEDFQISGRIIDVEKAVVLAADSVTMPKEELVAEARSYQFRYVERQGLGLSGSLGMDFSVNGLPWCDRLESRLGMARFGGGVAYRLSRFLQVSGGIDGTWTEIKLGPFDPLSPAYANSSVLVDYYSTFGDLSLPSYAVERSENYLHLAAYFVWNPLERFTLSLGGGGLLGMWKVLIKLSGLPVPLVYDASGQPSLLDQDLWVTKDVIMESGNGLLYGFLLALRAEYFVSPRVLFYLSGTYRMTFAGDPYRYRFGGLTTNTGDAFFELSQWQPNRTPYGDSLILDLGTAGFAAGISISF